MRLLMLMMWCLMLAPLSFAEQNVLIELDHGKILSLEKKAHTIYLNRPDIADYILRSPGLLFLTGKKIGQTKLQVLDATGHVLATHNIHVIYPVSELKELVKKIAPYAHVHLETSGQNLLLEGHAKTALEHKKIVEQVEKSLGDKSGHLIDLMRVNEQSQQINLRVKLIEISRSLNRAVGLNLSSTYQTGNRSVTLGSNTSALTAAGSTTAFDVVQNFGNFNITSLLSILDAERLATILAEPNITTVSGKTATIQVGGEVAITSSTEGLVPTNSVSYKTYGIKLKFTPEILENGRIRIQVDPSISRPVGDELTTLTNPPFLTRSVSTTVELMSGQSFAIAGLLQNQLEEKAYQVPGTQKIPVLKDVLRQEAGDHSEREFIIVIEPYIVHPTANGMKREVSAEQPLGQEDVASPGFIAHG